MKDSLYSHFTIIVTTCGRVHELEYTLKKLQPILDKGAKGIICDDGSGDSTSEVISQIFSGWHLVRNNRIKGLIYSRNRLMSLVTTPFAISLDDDANFLGEDPVPFIYKYFLEYITCGVCSFRVYWGKDLPGNLKSSQRSVRTKSFLGGAHAWRMAAWREIKEYPAWFIFYGEEEFASFQLFKKKWEVHYLPEVLVHHRVEIKKRKSQADYTKRLRRSLRAGWYLYFIFYPIEVIPRKLLYSIWIQLKVKVLKGDIKALKALVLAFGDILFNIKKIAHGPERLTKQEFKKYNELADTKIYWHPDDR